MKVVITIAAIAGTLLCAGNASAITLVDPNGATVEPLQSWANKSLSPTPDARVLVWMPGSLKADYNPCDGASACSFNGQFPSLFFANKYAVRPSTFFHELGHQYDYAMPEWKRQRFYEITGYGPNWNAGPDSAAERFAVAYSLCARGVKGVGKRWSRDGKVFFGRWHGEYDYSPASPRVHHAVCRMISASP